MAARRLVLLGFVVYCVLISSGTEARAADKQAESNADAEDDGLVKVEPEMFQAASRQENKHGDKPGQKPKAKPGSGHHKFDNAPQECMEVVDIAIIGGGAAGAYAAWRLKEEGRTIDVYEKLGRIGGRCYSVHVPDINQKAEMGATRFLPEVHYRLLDIITKLGIEYRQFTQFGADERVYHLRGQNFRQSHLITKPIPYTLRPEEAGKRYHKILADYNKIMIANPGVPRFETRWQDGTPLYMTSYWNEFLKYSSTEAQRYMVDAYAWDMLHDNANAEWDYYAHVTDDDDVDDEYLGLHTLNDGFQQIPERLIEDFVAASTDHRVYLNHRLLAINDTTNPEFYNMRFEVFSKGKKMFRDVCARQIILAVTVPALKQIYWGPFSEDSWLKEHLDSVIVTSAFKAFMAYETPWWRTLGRGPVYDELRALNRSLKYWVSDLPIRQTWDMNGTDDGVNYWGKALMKVSYSTGPSSRFWKPLIKHGEPHWSAIPGTDHTFTTRMYDVLNTFLAELFNVSKEEIPEPYASAVHHWEMEPHGAAWHNWAPGYNYYEVANQIVKPVDDYDVFIIGEAYPVEDFQGWIEGAILTTELMLARFFGIPPIPVPQHLQNRTLHKYRHMRP